MMEKKKTEVVVVGAGLAGLATAACLTVHAIPYVILEREDCIASLWHKKSYDSLHLHLAKQFCELPQLPHPPSCPTFLSKNQFITYIDNYVARFNLRPHLRCEVESALFDDEEGKWQVVARNLETGEVEEYVARFVVVATGENDKAVVPEFSGIESFPGEVIHSMVYRNGSKYKGKHVLVVGCGNSGMEIALDLSNFGAKASIVVRNEGDDYLIGEDGISKQNYPNHWKGKHGLYCAGLARKGIYGLANDAENIANDIYNLLKEDDAKKMN